MNRKYFSLAIGRLAAVGLLMTAAAMSCGQPGRAEGAPGTKKTIIVTYSALGSLVKELAGDDFEVSVLMPNGLDPHEWEPSAQEMARINKAGLVVVNGLGLEGGMEKALLQAQEAGVPFFTAAEHIAVRKVKPGEGIPGDDEDQAPGASDPHLWLDPQAMKSVIMALAKDVEARFGISLAKRAADLAQRLDALDADINAEVAELSPDRRLLVTGHESLGYFAERYGFILAGAIVPSLSTQSSVSAADIAALKATIAGRKVPTIFTELGTPPKVAQALASDVGVSVSGITTHVLPADGSYFTMMKELAATIVKALQ